MAATASAQVIIQNGGQLRIQGGGRVQIIPGGGLQIGQPRPTTSLRTTQYAEELRYPRLTWNNGEYFEGSIASADDHVLYWRAESHEPAWRGDIFTAPLQLEMAALRRIDFPKAFLPPPAEPFAFSLANGDRLFAEIVGVTSEGLVTSSRRHGPLTISLASIVSITRLKDEQVVYSGPTALNGWRQIESDRSNLEPRFSMSPDGGFVINTWNRSAFLSLDLPEKCEVRLKLKSTTRPEFAVGFTRSNASVVSLETWQNELVLVEKSNFVPVRTVSDTERVMDLRITWDRAAKEIAVYDWSGKQLAKLPTEQVALSLPGIAIKNKRRDLTIEHLSVRKWDGSPLLPLIVEDSTVELVDGTQISGQLSAAPDGSGFVVTEKSGMARPISLDQLRAFRQKSTPPPATPVTRVEYDDGTLITGGVQSIDNQVVKIKSSLLPQPVTTHLEGASRIKFAESKQPGSPPSQDLPVEKLDRLVIGSQSLSGQIEGRGDWVLRWRATGSLAAAEFQPDRGTFDIQRASVELKPEETSPAVFIMKGGQLLPGHLVKVTEGGLEVRSPFASVSKIADQDLQAVYFRDPEQAKPRGLDDPQWKLTKGTAADVQLTLGTLTLRNRASYGHPTILSGDEVRFTFNTPETYGSMAVELFKDSAESNGKAGTLHLMRSGNQFWCAVEHQDGQSRSSDYVGNIKPGPVKLVLTLRDGMLEVHANGIPLINAALPDEKRKGQGISFGPSEMWGGGQASTLQVSDFLVVTRPDHIPMPVIDEGLKTQALTVPRFRRESPPHQILLAPNGDVLRGRLEAFSGSALKFQSGLESVEIPLSRIRAAIWLSPADTAAADGTAKPVETTAIQPVNGSTLYSLVLQDGGRLQLQVDKFEAEQIRGHNAALGDCVIPYRVISTLRNDSIPPTAAMQAYSGWKLENAQEPVLPENGGQTSPLLGKPAPQFTIQRLGSVPFDLQNERGKVVVLDFWATWCGPCVAALPETLKVIQQFDRSQVTFLGVNQGEPESVVTPFLEKRGWEMEVALDSQQKVGAAYGVEGIPHTVIIGTDGKVVWTHTGNAPGDSAKLAAAIRQALGMPNSPP